MLFEYWKMCNDIVQYSIFGAYFTDKIYCRFFLFDTSFAVMDFRDIV